MITINVMSLLQLVAIAQAVYEPKNKNQIHSPPRAEQYAEAIASSQANCELKVQQVADWNPNHPECKFLTAFPGDREGPDSSVVKSYDADYWYPGEDFWRVHTELKPRGSSMYPMFTAKHQCQVVKGYQGCSQQFLQWVMDGDWYMHCPDKTGWNDSRYNAQSPFIYLSGGPPPTLAECKHRGDDKDAYNKAHSWMSRELSSREKLGVTSHYAVPGPSDQINLNADPNSQSSRYWHSSGGSR